MRIFSIMRNSKILFHINNKIKEIDMDIVIVSVIPFPQSQLCMSCKYGEFIQSKSYDSSHYLCHNASTCNDGIQCKEYDFDDTHSDEDIATLSNHL